ncbi:MAG: type II secretion system protein GspG [Holophagales bacterium]|jgi:hypothetical protein|nr:type II secretion system protein GspG [Holophagales bacterium]
MPILLILLLLSLAVVGCSLSDPRLPERLYEDALALIEDGKTLEARALMEEIVRRFPEKPEGISARQDIFMLEAILLRAKEAEKRQVRRLIQATCDALKRYRDRHGEYPDSLHKLVPDYGLDQLPLTPWKHPLFYRPYVNFPTEHVADRRGRTSIRNNTRFDSYHLACLGKDLRPGGEDADADILVVNGIIIQEKYLPPIPNPQPNR